MSGPPPSPAGPRAVWGRAHASFGVLPGEERTVLLMLAHSFAMGAATVFFETAASSLFLARFGGYWLPYVYVAAAALNMVTGLGYSSLQSRLSFRTLMLGTVGFLLVTTAALRAGLAASDAGWLVFLLLVWYRAVSILTDLEYWAVAGRIYDLRQAKRLFGLVGSGEVVARIAGAFSVPLLVHALGVANLLVLSAAFLLACLFLAAAILRGLEHMPERPASTRRAAPPPRDRARLSSLLAQPFIRVIVGLAFFSILAKYLVDYAFLHQMRAQFGDVKALASFFALFSGASQVLSLLTRVLVSGRLLNRFGVRTGLVILPLAHMACTTLVLASAVVPGGAASIFWLVVANQGIYKTLKHPIDNASFKVLYQPLRKDQRLATQVAVETLVTPLTIGLAGAIMILSARLPAGNTAVLAAIMLVVFGGWLAAAMRGGREYAGALLLALRGRLVDDGPFAYDDARSRAILRETLTSERSGDVLFALDLLGRTQHAELVPSLLSLLDHPAAEVRASVLQRLEAAGVPGTAHELAQRVKVETQPAVRALAVRALCGVLGNGARAAVAPLLTDPEPDVRRGALVGLLRAGDELAIPEVVLMAGAPSAAERAQAARIVGEVALRDLHGPLLWLLEDGDPEVRRAALAAAGRVGEPELFAAAVRSLGDRRFHGAALGALRAGGAAALPAMLAALERRAEGRVARDLVRLLGRLRQAQACPVLEACLDSADARVRTDALAALLACGYEPDEGGRARLRAYLVAEIAWAASSHEATQALREATWGGLLRDALKGEAAGARDRVLLLLAFLHDRTAILRARERLEQETGGAAREKRAFALEVLDLALVNEGDLRSAVLRLFEEPPPTEALATGLDERVSDVLRSASRVRPWTTATALHAVAMGAGGASALDLARELAARSAPGLVRQTAEWAVARATGAEVRGDHEGERMLTIERVICLRAVQMFEEASEEILADVAAILEELTVEKDEVVIEKGSPGDSMYIVVEGRVRVYDGTHTITSLGEREIFGELALLDPEPRFASVAALERTRLFRLDREAFSELMAGNIEIVRGVLHVLCERLRHQMGGGDEGPAPTGASVPGQGA